MKLEMVLQLVTLASIIGGWGYFIATNESHFEAFKAIVETRFEYITRDIAGLQHDLNADRSERKSWQK